ncbi:MAG: hypothetical protein ACYDEJ_15805 [Desulfitobacteriaceae bacterium]
MLFLSILSYILLSFGMLLAAIIVVPYNYNVSGKNITELQVNGLISWLFGGIKISFCQHSKQDGEIFLSILGLNKKLKVRQKSTSTLYHKDPEHSKNKKTVKSKKPSNFRQYLKKDIIKKALSLFLKILHHCQPKTLSIYARRQPESGCLLRIIISGTFSLNKCSISCRYIESFYVPVLIL